MKVSIDWLKELVDLNTSFDELIYLINNRTIGTKEVTQNFIELDMKGYNRADLLSMRGVALEIAAILNSKVKFEEEEPKLTSDGRVKASVQNSDLVPLYCLAKIEGLNVEGSPTDWKSKLESSGMRSVNNIVDVTNLVMLEYGQPLHSFDASKVQDENIIVRTARKDEEIKTLDGKVRKLDENDLVISDSKGAIGIAGVMGGEGSEVKSGKTDILLEAAIFDPVSIRSTAQRLNLTSEASKRFQHGLTKKRLLQAFESAIEMYQSLGGKLTGLTIVDNLKETKREVSLTLDKVNSLMGIELSADQVEGYLQALHFKLTPTSIVIPAQAGIQEDESRSKSGMTEGQSWMVEVPYFRLDIEIAEDLVEEIARLYGYEKIPSKELVGEIKPETDQTFHDLFYQLKTELVQSGFTEVQSYSFYSTRVINNLNIPTDKLIKVANPISSETEYLKDRLWPNLLEVTTENLKYFDDVAVFEVGKVYKIQDSKPKEYYKLAVALADNSTTNVHELYQLVKTDLEKVGIKIELKLLEENEENKKLFHPTKNWSIQSDNQIIGEIAEVHPRIVTKFGVEKRMSILDISLENLPTTKTSF